MLFYRLIVLFLFFLLFCEIVFAKNIGILYKKDSSIHDSLMESFIHYAEADNNKCIKIPLDKNQNLNDVINNIKTLKIDSILAIGDYVSKAAIASDLPGVFINIINPVKAGFIDSEGNLKTKLFGISMDIPMVLKFPLIKKIFPKLNELLVVYAEENSQYIINEYQNFSNIEKFSLRAIAIKDEKDLLKILEKNKKGISCIITIVDNNVYNIANTALALRFSVINRIPLIAFSSQLVNSGALIGFYSNSDELALQAFQTIISEELKTKISFPLGYSFSINLQMKNLFNAVINEDVISKADKIVRK